MFKRQLDPFKHENVGMFDLASIGITLALAICIGYFGGKWIGGKLGNAAIGSYIGFGIGVAAGFMEMFRSVARWNRQLYGEKKQDHSTSEETQNSEG
ncbi:MAG: AtpZ/AtpI family protein [Candidatus Poribacteria bacterium]|nr:AtpZ/AtpI family protein [Candidatus Poribacteria bacterium]